MAQILDEQAEAYNEDVPISEEGLERKRSASPLQRSRRVSSSGSNDLHLTPGSYRRYIRRTSRSDSMVSSASSGRRRPRLSPPLAMDGYNYADFLQKPPSPSIQRRISSLHSKDSASIISSPPSETVDSVAESSLSQYATPESTPSLHRHPSDELVEEPEVETPSLARMEDEKRLRTRARAIQELISTEWMYAQDLAIARDVYYARAHGVAIEQISAHLAESSDFVPPPTPAMQAHGFVPMSPDLGRRSFAPSPALASSGTFSPRSSIGASRAASPLPSPAAPILSAKDIKTIFVNLIELAEFGAAFSGVLDDAAGSTMKSDTSGEDDRLGEEFLAMMPRIASIYSTYCSRHGAALARLEELESSLTSYLSECQNVCKSLTHSWSLGSLLIKPVQRCLKYPLLIETVLNNTLPSHPDYANLESALEKMLAVAQELNEAKRRNDLVTRAMSKEKSLTKVKPRKSNGFTTSRSTASFTQTVSKKLLRSGYRVQRATGFDAPADSESEEDAILNTLIAQFNQQQSDVDSLATDIRSWLSHWSILFETTRQVISAWIEAYAPLAGEADIQGGGRDTMRAYLRLLEQIEEELLAQMSFRLNAKTLPALGRLEPLFQGPRLVIEKRDAKRIDFERFVRHPNDRSAQEGRIAYLGLSRSLAAELPIFVASITRAVDHVVTDLARIQTDFYRAKHARLLVFERMYCSKFAGGGDLAEAWWQLVQPLHAAVDGLSCTRSALLMHRIDGQRAALSEWRSSKTSDSTESSVLPQRTRSAPGVPIEQLSFKEGHQRQATADSLPPPKTLKKRTSTFWTRKSGRSGSSIPPSPDELASIRQFFSKVESGGSSPVTPITMTSNSSTVSLVQEQMAVRYHARATRGIAEGLTIEGRTVLSLRTGDHVAVLWEEGSGWSYVRDERDRMGFVPRDSLAALPPGAS